MSRLDVLPHGPGYRLIQRVGKHVKSRTLEAFARVGKRQFGLVHLLEACAQTGCVLVHDEPRTEEYLVVLTGLNDLEVQEQAAEQLEYATELRCTASIDKLRVGRIGLVSCEAFVEESTRHTDRGAVLCRVQMQLGFHGVAREKDPDLKV